MQDADQITRQWVERLSPDLGLEPSQVLPHQNLLDDIPLVLRHASEFLRVPDTEVLTAEQVTSDEMRNIALLRQEGSLEIESSSGSGTTLFVRVPAPILGR